MTQPFLEHCCKCDEPTGRAGKHEDSLYAGPYGPYCEECWTDVPGEIGEALSAVVDGLRKAEINAGDMMDVLAAYRAVRRAALASSI